MRFATDIVHHLLRLIRTVNPAGMTSKFGDQCVADLENKILELGPETVACFVAEPLLASGGVIVPPPGYQRRTWEVCRKYGVLYVSDEVVTGFGRLGHVFASEPVFDFVPDIITSAKGLTSGYVPLGAFIVSDALYTRLLDQAGPGEMFANGFTYSRIRSPARPASPRSTSWSVRISAATCANGARISATSSVRSAISTWSGTCAASISWCVSSASRTKKRRRPVPRAGASPSACSSAAASAA